jgi:hypothetical protein
LFFGYAQHIGDKPAMGFVHKFRERGLPAYSWQGNFASCVALRAARSPV